MAHAGGYAIYRTTFTPSKALQSRGARMVFREIGGSAEVFVGGALVGAKTTVAPGRWK